MDTQVIRWSHLCIYQELDGDVYAMEKQRRNKTGVEFVDVDE